MSKHVSEPTIALTSITICPCCSLRRPGTKEDSSIEYDIELVRITLGKDLEEMTPEEILDVGLEFLAHC
jgi:hypothetical protein